MDYPNYCLICKESFKEGIKILHKFICSECEKTIVNIDINDTDYEIYKDKIKENIAEQIV